MSTPPARKAAAALAAIEAQAATGSSYSWPDRSCVSLVEALCAALGVAAPAYGPWRKLREARATARVRRSYGGMGAGHQAGLTANGWQALDPSLPVEPGDVVSYAGLVVLSDWSRHDPTKPGIDFTGIAGPDGHVYGWGPGGIATVVEGVPGWLTRML